MFEKVSSLVTKASVERGPVADSGVHEVAVKRLFMLFHGYYGNLFLSKFATGEVDAEGKDRGIKSARAVWQSELSDFDVDTLVTAAKRCKEDHKDFPPSLPQFAAICRAAAPRKAMAAPTQIGMSGELQSEYTRRSREQALAALRARTATAPDPVDGLTGLKQAIANAVAAAGGDEVAELLRLDRMLAPKVGS